jgi:hypothetical protein
MRHKDKRRIHLVRAGETFATIAKVYYGDSNGAGYLWRHNEHEVPDPNSLTPGTRIVIPRPPL